MPRTVRFVLIAEAVVAGDAGADVDGLINQYLCGLDNILDTHVRLYPSAAFKLTALDRPRPEDEHHPIRRGAIVIKTEPDPFAVLCRRPAGDVSLPPQPVFSASEAAGVLAGWGLDSFEAAAVLGGTTVEKGGLFYSRRP